MNFSLISLRISGTSSSSPALSLSSCASLLDCQGFRLVSPFALSSSTLFARNSVFSYFLSNAFKLSCLTYSKPTRISSFSESINFSYCIFSIMSGSAQGGAIYSTSSYSIGIKFCVFYCCTTTSNGGAIFASASNLSIASTCFSLCYITTVQNELFGNAVYSAGFSFAIAYSMYTLCGPAVTSAADSSIFTTSALCRFQYNNATNNRGTYGPVDCTVYCPLNSMTNTDGASTGIEFRSAAVMNPCYFNLINLTNSNTWGLLYTTIQSVTFSCAIIMKCTNSNICYCESGGGIAFVNCVGDTSSSELTYLVSTVTYSIGELFENGCQKVGTQEFSNDEQIQGIFLHQHSSIVLMEPFLVLIQHGAIFE